MIDQAPWILPGLLVMGFSLMWWGVRGRRLNDHPVCRRCRFDLHGVYPGGKTCPECGGGLGEARSVRAGVRKRRRAPLVVGSVMLGIGALVIGAAVWLMAAGPSMNKHKPAVLLALEGRYAGPKASREAAKELFRRMQLDELSDTEIAWSVETSLSLQRERRRAWIGEWGDVVEEARSIGKVTDATYTTFLRQSVVLDCRVRPDVTIGARLPLVVGVAEWRRSKVPMLDVGVWIESIRVDGKRVEWGYHGDRRLALNNSESPLRITSAWGARTKSASADSLGLELDLPADVGIGARVIEIEVRVSAEAGASAPRVSGIVPFRIITTLSRPVVVSAPQAPSAGVVADAAATEMVRRVLSGTTVEFSVAPWGGEDNQPVWRAIAVVPRVGSAPAFAYDVWLRVGEREHLAGYVVSGQMPRRGRLGVGAGGVVVDSERDVLLVAEMAGDLAPGPDVTTCDVIFRPRPDLAPLTLDMTECLGAEIVVEGVKAVWQARLKPGDRGLRVLPTTPARRPGP